MYNYNIIDFVTFIKNQKVPFIKGRFYTVNSVPTRRKKLIIGTKINMCLTLS